MKKSFSLLLLLFVVASFAQTSEKIRYSKITQQECVKKKGYRLQLVKVISDSRCPADVTCIWAGEAQVLVAVYENKKHLFEETITLSPKNTAENLEWFSKYTGKKVKQILLFPLPKSESSGEVEKPYLKIGYTK